MHWNIKETGVRTLKLSCPQFRSHSSNLCCFLPKNPPLLKTKWIMGCQWGGCGSTWGRGWHCTHAGTHTLGVRTCKWDTYAASRSKLGQHLDRHTEFNCPLSCGLYLQGSVKEKWHRGTVQWAFRIDPAILLRYTATLERFFVSNTNSGSLWPRITVWPRTKARERAF